MKIVLSADKSLMSTYNNMTFLGFAACAPKFLPAWIYKKIFCPPLEKEKDGQLLTAHCGQRKIQAALLSDGFNEKDIGVVDQSNLSKFINHETKVVCITTHDPLGQGPASSTFSDLGGREPYTSYFFRKLLNHPSIKKNNVKVIVGGSGSWQLADTQKMADYGIDCVVMGEGEVTAVNLINKVLNSEEIPKIVQGDVVPLEHIPLIQKPTINGIIEVCRGCGRGCRFCNPTMLNFRCQPLEYIKKEALVNKKAGNIITLHSEDIFRYQADGFIPNEKAVISLFSEMKKITDDVGISHFSYSSIVAKPSLVEQVSEILEVGSKNYPFMSGQVGVETGSTVLIDKYMKGKVKPFKPDDWNDIVIKGNQILADNKWIPVETLIMGLPGETASDVQKTIELIDELAGYRSFIVPLFFVPIGTLKGHSHFNKYQCLPEHWQLLAQCIRHTVKWSYDIVQHEPLKELNGLKKWMIIRVLKIMERKMNPYLKLMEEGVSPIKNN